MTGQYSSWFCIVRINEVLQLFQQFCGIRARRGQFNCPVSVVQRGGWFAGCLECNGCGNMQYRRSRRQLDGVDIRSSCLVLPRRRLRVGAEGQKYEPVDEAAVDPVNENVHDMIATRVIVAEKVVQAEGQIGDRPIWCCRVSRRLPKLGTGQGLHSDRVIIDDARQIIEHERIRQRVSL